MFTIMSNGPHDLSTNFWDSDIARGGFVFLSWNHGIARLLVPDTKAHTVNEMLTARHVVVSAATTVQGLEAIEILFEDGSDSPFVILCSAQQCDRRIADDPTPTSMTIWTRNGPAAMLPCVTRRAKETLCLSPWGSTIVRHKVFVPTRTSKSRKKGGRRRRG
ncbi:hypothetical protein DFR29_103317 [Tahibacter aquaticus]|uniref:Uncharacterized protein n=1 Tax=Tahibacter aquaticus TaxID=520092 RepID=A0A4R6Z538_9GAMM|nr:hypothetical protein [Tahibacter aquaticus]TDR46781.1 hypothetical protein DFR29_103317 [Tahibacter aquaticus]